MTATSAEIAVQIPRTRRYDIDPPGSTAAFTGRPLFGSPRCGAPWPSGAPRSTLPTR
jgi:hypothetical protein